MSLLDEIVKINIVRDQVGITRVGFGTGLIIGETTPVLEVNEVFPLVKRYTNLAAVAKNFPGPGINTPATPEYTMASKYFSQEFKPDVLCITIKNSTDTFLEAYQKASDDDGDFYGIMTTSVDEDDVLAIAEEIERDKKIFGWSTSSEDVINDVDGNILKDLKDLGYNRTFIVYSPQAEEETPEAALFGRMLTTVPGSETWAYKNLKGITPHLYTALDALTLNSDYANYYALVAGSGVTINGRMVGGEYIDVIHGLDWLEQYMKENVFLMLKSAPKIPFTDQGIGLVENTIRGSLKDAVDRGIINEDFTVTVPKVNTVSIIDKGNRFLPGAKFTATKTGAIHTVRIEGTVSI